MDRIDIHLEVPSVPYKDLSAVHEGSSSREILGRVLKAKQMQSIRFDKAGNYNNASMSSRQVKIFCKIDSESNDLLEKARDRFGLSARAHARILKISNTIADLEGASRIKSAHLAEAIQYRTLDRRMRR